MYKEISEKLIAYIKENPSSFHVVENLEKELVSNGYETLQVRDSWNLTFGGKYLVKHNNSSLFAIHVPKENYDGFRIVASHCDTPSFKIKTNPEVDFEKSYTLLNVERYGGPLMAPWFDRPLSIAGRVVYEEQGEIKEVNIDFKEDCISIVNLAIHQNRQANSGIEYKVGKDMLPIWAGVDNQQTFAGCVAKLARIKEEQILDTELFLYNTMEGKLWGANKEFLSAPRLDDLQCVYASKEAFLSEESVDKVNVLAVFDNEEVGSSTKQGAQSSFLKDLLARISLEIGKTIEQHSQCIANSFLLSADNGHAVHPNYPEKSDKTNHVFPNKGIVIKYAANQLYTTDGRSGAFVKMLCKKSDVSYQVFHNHSDVAGGSTLGNIAVQHLPISAADIGAAQLAMHSPYETVGVKDTHNLMQVMKELYK